MKIVGIILSLIVCASAQTANKFFWTLTAANASMSALDAYTTVAYIGKGWCREEVTSPGLYGSSPSAARVTLVMGGIFVTSVGLSYLMKKHRLKLWKIPLWEAPQSYNAYGHALGGVHNLRYCR